MNDASGGGVEICCCSDDGNDGIQRSWRNHCVFLSLRWAVLPWGSLLRLYGKGLLLISRYAHDEPSIQIVLMLLLPFIVYLVAEHFGLSGILAAVAAG